VCPFAPAFIDLPQGDLTHDNALNTGGFSTTEANAPFGVAANSALNPDFRSQGFWERHPSQLYGTSDQVSVRTMSVRVDEAHFQAECAGVGLCDRSSGQCSCFPGYGGAACNRTVCPGECSGHGICRSLEETLPAEIEWYRLWEASKSVRCVCDAGFSGLDCAQRTCARGDDPLTVTTTRPLYNMGLAETAEVQNVDIRCRFGGQAINPMVQLTYTDPDTNSMYSTGFFDLSNSAMDGPAIMAMLKALPNDILADYAVDGVVISSRIMSVMKTEIESSNLWRITINFDKSLGDVPDVEVTLHKDFMCKNALNVDTGLGGYESRENVVATAIGDGPRKQLIFDVSIDTIPGNVDVMTYTVSGEGMTALSQTTPEAHSLVGATAMDFKVLDNAAKFDREAALVQFIFEAAEGTDSTDIRSGNSTGLSLKYRLTYEPAPQVTVSNPTAVLGQLNEYWNRTRQVFPQTDGTRQETIGGSAIWIDSIANTAKATVDYRVEIANGPKDYNFNETVQYGMPDTRFVSDSRAELLINGEHAAFINGTIPIEGFQHLGNTFLGQVPNPAIFGVRIPTTFRNEVPVFSFNSRNLTNNTVSLVANSSFIAFTPKSPLVVMATGVDTIRVDYLDNEAVNESLVLVLKIVSTSSSPDTFAWKFSGDENFMDNGGLGYPIPTAEAMYAALPGAIAYRDARPDEGRRWQAPKILLHWVNGNDFDKRIACTPGNTNFYYIQFGSDGLNDRPVCADRGVCDSSSGQCGCYAGYTGADCSEQNALARGGARTA